MQSRTFIRYIQKIPFVGIGFLCIALLAIVITGSLLAFSPQDPSLWLYTQGVSASWFVFARTTIAAFLFRLFGAAAYSIAPLLWLCAVLYYAVWKEKTSFMLQWERLLVGLAFPFFGAAYCTVQKITIFDFTSPGGLFGGNLCMWLSQWIDMHAQQVIWFFVVLMSLVILMRSWLYPLGVWVGSAARLLFKPDGPLFWFMGLLYQLGHGVAWQLRAAVVWMYDTVTGALVKNSEASIVEFEDHERTDDQVHQILQDVFWQTYLPKKSSPAHNAFAQKVDELDMQDSAQEPAVQQASGATKTVMEKQQPQAEATYAVPDLQEFSSKHMRPKQLVSQEDLQVTATTLEEKLQQFGISGKVVATHAGPVVTLFEYAPESNVKLSKIVGLQDDLAMALKAQSIRILAPIPGKAVVGFEVANVDRQSVHFSHLQQSQEFADFSGQLPLILGEDTLGRQVIVDLATMPHLLLAGSTGAGKSVALNAMLASLLCKFSPEEVKLVIIDPKRLEFAQYEDIAHLVVPIVTDPRKAASVLKWVVHTMEGRYELMARCGVRNISEYQEKQKKDAQLEAMPWMVVMIDELADLMMTAGKEVEELLARLAQMARAAGIHIIVATQRPSVDVITGMIKVNFTSRISFKVTSKFDSRTILDDVGAEQLLGRGDMLFLSPRSSHVARVHGAYISDAEIDFIVQRIKSQKQPDYQDIHHVLAQKKTDKDLLDGDEELYQEIVSFLQDIDEVSISMLQRQFRIGYNRSARIIAKLEADGIVMSSDGGKMRRVVK